MGRKLVTDLGYDLCLGDAISLLEEVQRLQDELAQSAARVRELEAVAHIDPLVNLANRRSFLGALGKSIARVDRYGAQAAMIFLDVDGLKGINDKFGHIAGDRALIEIARLLLCSVREVDLVARLSGDEFAVLLEQADELCAWETALRIVETVDECEFRLSGVRLPLSVAVGVGVIEPSDTPESVIARADGEMYRMKAI